MPLISLRRRRTPGGSTSITLKTHEARKEEYTASKTQREITFRESLQRKFEAEEEARSVGEHTRRDDFDRLLTKFGDIFLESNLRQQELYKESDALQEERFQKANTAREPIFVQGQNNRARAFELDQELRSQREVWYKTARQELLINARQRLENKCAAIKAALVDQFDRLMSNQIVLLQDIQGTSIQKPQPALTHVRYPSKGPDLTKTLSTPPSTLEPRIPPIPLADTLSLRPHSVQNSLNSSIPSTSAESHHKQEEPFHFLIEHIEQEDTKRSSNRLIVDVTFYTSFARSQKQRQDTYLDGEREKEVRFHTSEATREAGESERSVIFDQKLQQWSELSQQLFKSQTDHFRGREEERSRDNTRYSVVFETAQEQCRQVFDISLSHIVEQAEAEADFDDIWLEHQKSMMLALYKSQSIQLTGAQCDQGHQIVRESISISGAVASSSLGVESFMSTRRFDRQNSMLGNEGSGYIVDDGESELPIPRSWTPSEACARSSHSIRADVGFVPTAILRGGPFIQDTLPVAQDIDNVDQYLGQEHWNLERMQRVFEQSQQSRAEVFGEGASERCHIFTINEAKRGTEFKKAQHIRQVLFDNAENSRELGFHAAHQDRESEFQTNEGKREDEFRHNEKERSVQARRAQEDRERRYYSTMLILQRNCINDEKRRMEELEAFAQRLVTSREHYSEIVNGMEVKVYLPHDTEGTHISGSM